MKGRTNGQTRQAAPNGTRWEQVLTATSFYSIEYGAGIWVLASYYAPYTYYSEDGKQWNAGRGITTSMRCVKYAKKHWVAGLQNGIAYSENGKDWIKCTIGPSSLVRCVEYANDIWVATSNGNGLWYSEDGKEWHETNASDPPNAAFEKVYFANGLWIAIGGHVGFLYSYDGKVWNHSNIETEYADSVCYGDGIWIVVSEAYLPQYSHAYYSYDGKVWNNLNLVGKYKNVYYSDGLWLITGYSGTYYSHDGRVWTKIEGLSLGKVLHANGIWIGGNHYSKDGITWFKTNTKEVVYSIVFENGVWIYVTSNKVYRSPSWSFPEPKESQLVTNAYGIPDSIYETIQQDVVNEIVAEVSMNE